MTNFLANLRYKGSMRFPLVGATTQEHFNQTTLFTGDFKNPNHRKHIFSKPRNYKFTVTLLHMDGKQTDESEYSMPDNLLDKDTLTQLIK